MKNNSILFFILYTIIFSGTVVSKELLGTEKLVYDSLAERLTTNQLQEIIHMNNLWGWVFYIILPLFLYLKIITISTLLAMNVMFLNTKIKFKQLFNIVIKSEFVFLLPMVFKTLWFYFFRNNYSLEEMQNYIPLSLESLFGYKNFEPWFIYPLQVVNLFEVLYWVILTFLLAKTLQTTKNKALILVTSSYGIGLIIWVAGNMFLILNLN